MANILDRIVQDTYEALVARQHAVPERALRARLADAPPVRDFVTALVEGSGDASSLRPATFDLRPAPRVIAEIKRASPSAGWIRQDADPPAIGRSYEANGAAAISVLTEPLHFRGSLDDLMAVRGAVGIPVLRKDFVIDAYQVLEARAAGADAVLLIAAILNDDALRHLLETAHALGFACLVEVHSQAELDRVLATDAPAIGINNRDLTTFKVDLATTERLIAANDLGGRVVVSESGIKTAADLARLAAAGVHAVLVGEALMRHPDPGAALRALLTPSVDRPSGLTG